MMRAAQYTEHSSDVQGLKLVEIVKPEPEPGMAIVQVKYAAINPVDWKVMAGYLNGMWATPLPFTMGYDFSGVLVGLHDDEDKKTTFQVGDEVFAVQWANGQHDDADNTSLPIGGAFAEYIKVPLDRLSKKPSGVSHSAAAAVALAGTTAYQVVCDCATVQQGQRILVLGGSTAVGSLAVQIAKHKGAWVATTCSKRTNDYVQQFQPDLTVDYTSQKWEDMDNLKGLDAVLDTVGETDAFQRTKDGNVVKEGGSFVTIATADVGFDPTAHPPFRYAAFFCLSNNTKVQDELASMIANKSLKVVIDKEFAFTEKDLQDMVAYSQSGKAMGKIVLRVQD